MTQSLVGKIDPYIDVLKQWIRACYRNVLNFLVHKQNSLILIREEREVSGRHFIEKVTNNVHLNGYSIGYHFPPFLLPPIVGGAWQPPKLDKQKEPLVMQLRRNKGQRLFGHKNAQEVCQEVVTGGQVESYWLIQ